MAWMAPQSPARRDGATLTLGVALVALLCAGCASGVSAQASAPPTATAAPTAPLTRPTATSSAPCASIGADPGTATTLKFPLPPGTVSQILPGAAGAGFFLECTPGATQASITAYFDTALPQAGWRKWNPQTDDAHGCGTEANDYWQWAKGQSAVGWLINGPVGPALPEWMLTFCSLAYGAS